MRSRWPAFSVVRRGRDLAVWEGRLRPLFQWYTVRVELERHGPSAGDWLPLVTVTDPLLRRRAEAPREAIPHVYENRDCALRPYLCLYYPPDNEWDGSLAVAKTVMPWAVDWLVCYEGWLLTGRWDGGGVH